MTVFEMIEAQQKGKENTAPWMVGEQLKEICKTDAACAEIVAKDLEVAAMSIAECEKKIKAWVDKQKRTGNCVCVPPNVAEKIIREFYGLPEAMTAKQTVPTGDEVAAAILDLDELMGL